MSESLPLDHDELLHKLIANKATRGYQLEFTTFSGRSYFGFVIGLDKDSVQILVTPFGRERGNIKHRFNSYSLADEFGNGDTDYYQLLFLTNIEAVSENRLALKHFNDESRKKIERAQKAFVLQCENYLKTSGR